MTALSQTLPDRLIEQATPLSAISRWNFSLVYWLPWSEWCSKASYTAAMRDLGNLDRRNGPLGQQLGRE